MYRCIKIVLTVFFAIFFASLSEGKFPNDPKPCPYGDGECIKEIINYLLSEKIEGYAPLNMINMNPLKISEIFIKQGKESPVNIDLAFRNAELTGLKGGKALEVKGFGKNISEPHKLVLRSNSATVYSDYTVKGKILILPITGTGKSNITFENITVTMTIYGEPREKNGETYMNVKYIQVDVATTRIYFSITNLFDGNKELGDNMNLFLNENWEYIFEEVRDSIKVAFAKIFKSVIRKVFQKYPYANFFAQEQ